jgi:putative transposase
MPKGLKRYYGAGELHYITCSCHQRKRWLDTGARRNLFLKILEELRREHRFVVLGYVVMPEHFHLLMSEPQVGNPSTAMQSVKQRFAQRVVRRRRRRNDAQAVLWEAGPMPVWQPRFYDFNVWTERKRVEKLRYMHRNPVKRGLVQEPEQWLWSSCRYYKYGESGLVRLNDCDILRMRETARVMPAPAPCEKAARSGAPKT